HFLDDDPVERYDQFAHALTSVWISCLLYRPDTLRGRTFARVSRHRPYKEDLRKGHHERVGPLLPRTLASITEILSFPPASLAASINAPAASSSESFPCNSWLMLSSSSMSDSPSEHRRYTSPGMRSCKWVSSSTVSSTPTARVTRFL